MMRFYSEAVARDIAMADGLLCGLCPFDGLWYVGTSAELASVFTIRVR